MTAHDFVFKVTRPVRATLHVAQAELIHFRIVECTGTNNAELAKADLEKIEADLRKALATLEGAAA